jgi:drug/metabolite transporter (DMT)-like permease
MNFKSMSGMPCRAFRVAGCAATDERRQAARLPVESQFFHSYYVERMNRHTIELLVLAALWGGSFLFMRVAAPELGPIPMIALRVGIASLMLSPVLLEERARTEIRTYWKPLLIVGISNSALPFCMFGYSMLYLNAGFDAILNATTPLWTAAIAAVWFRLPLSRATLLGLVFGVAGVAILVSDSLSLQGVHVSAAIAAVMIATISYGFASNYSRRHLAGVKPTTVAFASMAFATLVLILPALATLPSSPVPLEAWLATLGLGVLCTGIAYVIYFRLIADVGAGFAASVTFLVPIFGMIWGALFLGESVTPLMLGGCAVILFGAALITGRIRLPVARSSG